MTHRVSKYAAGGLACVMMLGAVSVTALAAELSDETQVVASVEETTLDEQENSESTTETEPIETVEVPMGQTPPVVEETSVVEEALVVSETLGEDNTAVVESEEQAVEEEPIVIEDTAEEVVAEESSNEDASQEVTEEEEDQVVPEDTDDTTTPEEDVEDEVELDSTVDYTWNSETERLMLTVVLNRSKQQLTDLRIRLTFFTGTSLTDSFVFNGEYILEKEADYQHLVYIEETSGEIVITWEVILYSPGTPEYEYYLNNGGITPVEGGIIIFNPSIYVMTSNFEIIDSGDIEIFIPTNSEDPTPPTQPDPDPEVPTTPEEPEVPTEPEQPSVDQQTPSDNSDNAVKDDVVEAVDNKENVEHATNAEESASVVNKEEGLALTGANATVTAVGIAILLIASGVIAFASKRKTNL